MKKNLTEMVFILDRSGSMSGLTNDTIGGFNSMIENQRKEDGMAKITTVLFDHEYKLLHDNVDISEVKEMTTNEYSPRGMTALLDAIGRTVNTVGERLHNTEEKDRPEKVIVVITTDGFENASKEFSRDKIKSMIEEQQQKYNWTFMFIGANIDAIGEAQSLGIDVKFARNYTSNQVGTQSVYSSLSKGMYIMRSCDLSDLEQQAQLKACLDEIK